MLRRLLLLLLAAQSSLPFSSSDPTPYCQQQQRFDTTDFPPRCIACPLIVPNRVALSLIPTQARIARRPVSKFSPGLPQNETCGCWRAPMNLSIDVALNSSAWIVSGMAFSSTTKGQWLRNISVRASSDNISFIDWGTYIADNSTDAALLLFSYPVRARFFRIIVHQYANHHVNDSSGFAFSARALVGTTQPFACRCPLLSTGQCCPYANMTVRNDQCIWCMDPTQISTVVVDGCGKCRLGTFEYMGRCYYRNPQSAINNLEVTAPQSNGVHWAANISVTADARTEAFLYLTSDPSCSGPPCYIAAVSEQYVQFDRGRYVLNMTEPAIRSWASCINTVCTGYIGARFITTVGTASSTQDLKRQLIFETGVTSLILSGGGTPSRALAHLELHYFPATDTWLVRMTGMLWEEGVYVQWDEDPSTWAPVSTDSYYTLTRPPPINWTDLRVSDRLNVTTLQLLAPASPVVHGAAESVQYSGMLVSIQYGLGMRASPSPGDSERIVLITAKSPAPIRLKRLVAGNVSYTTPKGFIIDSSSVLDLSIACGTQTMQQWLNSAVGLLPQQKNQLFSSFITQSCLIASTASRAYWMVPSIPTTTRTDAVQMSVVAEFV